MSRTAFLFAWNKHAVEMQHTLLCNVFGSIWRIHLLLCASANEICQYYIVLNSFVHNSPCCILYTYTCMYIMICMYIYILCIFVFVHVLYGCICRNIFHLIYSLIYYIIIYIYVYICICVGVPMFVVKTCTFTVNTSRMDDLGSLRLDFAGVATWQSLGSRPCLDLQYGHIGNRFCRFH